MCIRDRIPILYVQMDGTGVPVVKKETLGRQGKADGQPAHTREVKLGCVFTQTTWDAEGFALRDPDSTTSVSYTHLDVYKRQDLVLVSVPSDTARHLGWARQETPEELQAEAHVIVQQFTTENLEGRRLWVVLERGKTSDALTETLSRSLNPVGVDALRGSFFDEVRAFTPKTHTQPTSPVSLR